MSNRIVITNETIEQKEYRIMALFEENRLAEVCCENVHEESVLGNIYIGKIKNIVPKINAAFVEIAPGEMTYLSLDEVKQPWMVKQQRKGLLTENDELVVQITREAVKTKTPTVSTNLTFQGNAVVITTENKKLGISKKLDKEKRNYLKQLFANKKADRFGLILRTSAGNYADEQIFAEYQSIFDKFSHIEQYYKHRTCYSCLYRTEASYVTWIREKQSRQIEKIITDDTEVYKELTEGATADQAVFYEDEKLSLSALYGLKYKLMDALKEKVYLKSGAYLVIQPTEALTVIDVNSGKCTKGNKTDFYLKVNLEAAGEIARQLRLRNISGICIVDFINMDTKEAQTELVHALKKALAEDTVPSVFIDFTKLGLAEITRKKVKKPLWEQVRLTGSLE